MSISPADKRKRAKEALAAVPSIVTGFHVITYQSHPDDNAPPHLQAACTLLDASGHVVCYLHGKSEEEALERMSAWVEAGAERERARRAKAVAAGDRMRARAEERRAARQAAAPDASERDRT